MDNPSAKGYSGKKAFMDTSKQPGWSGYSWRELRTNLLRLDGELGALVNAEKHVVHSAVIFGEVAGQLGRIAQQMGLDTDDGKVEQSGKASGFEPVKPGFTRITGSFRRQSHRMRSRM